MHLLPKDAGKLEVLLKGQDMGYSISGGRYIIPVASTLDALPLVNRVENLILGFEVISGSMDDAFISITGKEMREDVV